MTRDELLQKVNDSWADLAEVVAGVKPSQMAPLHAEGEWTIKDVLAHVTWYEREMVVFIQTRTLGGSELWELRLPARNEAIYALIKEYHLADVLEKFQWVHNTLVGSLETLCDEDLADPAHFAGMPADWQPWDVIASNTFEHYPEHALQIKDMLAKMQENKP